VFLLDEPGRRNLRRFRWRDIGVDPGKSRSRAGLGIFDAMPAQTDRLNTALAGRYRIERHLGEGGMASVYLAEDLKHDRKVALKLLKPELAAVLGAERFVLEIKTTASLQHPHILPLFDSGTTDGFLFYVMPYIQGETLRDKLNRETQLGVDEAVRIARDVADALDYAHRHGVIHRDIKPENILLHDGRPMVADFGIALAVSAAAGGRMTETGLSLGTPYYMSPEQATADKEISARSDVYSLGSVLYEMLAGAPPHTGASAQQIIMKIITEPAEAVTKLRKSVPPHVAAAVAKSLEKLPADRFESAKAFGDALGNPGFTTGSDAGTAPRTAAERAGVSRRTFAVTAGIAALAIGAAVWPHLSPRAERPRAAVRFSLVFEPNERVTDGIGSPFAVSPDGTLIVYCASRGNAAGKLYVRRLGELKARELAATEGAFQPAFSSDGQWIAFSVGNQVKKVPVEGGTPIPLATLSAARGIAWIPGGDLVVGGVDGGLMLIPATGGTPRAITTIRSDSGESSHRWPVVVPDGKTVIYESFGGGALAGSRLGIATLTDGKSHTTRIPGTFPLGLIDGQLLFVNADGAVMAARYDARAHEISGAPMQVSEQAYVDPVAAFARAAVSPAGTLIYQGGASTSQLVLADARGGATRAVISEERSYGSPRFSPDGRKIAFSVLSGTGTDIWIYDRDAGTVAKLTGADATSNERPEWSGDGQRVLFRSTREGTALWWQPADLSGPATVLEHPSGFIVPEGVISRDGKTLLYRLTGGKLNQDIWYRSLAGDTTPKPWITSPFYETAPRFSVDGRWVAYSTDESGARQVYVSPFPGPGPHFQVSVDGGEEPVWAPDGKRLYYVNGRQLIAASVHLEHGFSVTERQVLFEGNYVFNYVHANYDISPDGQHFLLLKASGATVQATVVYDWRAELRAKTVGRAVK
jgi:eukaryotic-like serine/threonine-protein kinase